MIQSFTDRSDLCFSDVQIFLEICAFTLLRAIDCKCCGCEGLVYVWGLLIPAPILLIQPNVYFIKGSINTNSTFQTDSVFLSLLSETVKKILTITKCACEFSQLRLGVLTVRCTRGETLSVTSCLIDGQPHEKETRPTRVHVENLQWRLISCRIVEKQSCD